MIANSPTQRLANDQDLTWLFNGFDEAAARRIDAAFLEGVLASTPTPSHWVFGTDDDDPAAG